MTLRFRPFQFWMARLALFAMLLVALAPSVSRWLHESDASQPQLLLALCTVDGLESRPANLFATGEQIPEPDHPMQDGYCGHCPLLASIAPLFLAVLVLLPPSADIALPEWHAPVLHVSGWLRTLGARGPPVLL